MARIIICCLVICLAVVFSEACHPSGSGGFYPAGYREFSSVPGDSSSYRTVPGDSSSYRVVPNYDTESSVIHLTTNLTITRMTPPVSRWQYRRDVDSKKNSIFKSIDMNSNQFIEICEWVKEGGSAINFVAFLSDDDTDGDEKISWQEFQAVNV